MKTAIILLVIYFYFNPSLDKTSEGEILLWFWDLKRKKRKYIKI